VCSSDLCIIAGISLILAIVSISRISSLKADLGGNGDLSERLDAVESAANMAGISISEVATEVKRNDPGPKGICDIGNAKIKELDMSQMMGQ
jgi:hypothetical protein